MSVLRFEPFADPFRELDRLTGRLLSGGSRVPLGMPMDVYREGDLFVIELDLPGAETESVDVTVERGTLTIRAERRPSYGENAEVVVAERPQGAFTRQLVLGDTLDAEKLEAQYTDGVLRVTIPVAESAQPRRVEIQRGGSGPQTISGSVESGGSADKAVKA